MTAPEWEKLILEAEAAGLLPPYRQEILDDARKRGRIGAALPRNAVSPITHNYPLRIDEFEKNIH